MSSESRKWMTLVATTWIQAFTGTNFDFSAYSTELKSVLGISQVQLNYLAVASDLGKAFGWSSGLALMHLPLWTVLFMAAFMGFVGYGVQWLVIQNFISLPYFLVFLMCLLAGCSICWFNTVCFVLCIGNFSANRALALALTISFNGVSPALYTLAANSISPSNDKLYLLLNSLIPFCTSIVALLPILHQPPHHPLPSSDTVRHDSFIFLFLNILSIFTGLYLLLLNSFSSVESTAHFLFAGAIFLLVLPMCIPGILYARNWVRRKIDKSFRLEGSGFNLVDVDDLDQLHKELIISRQNSETSEATNADAHGGPRCFGKDRLVILGEEHSARVLVHRWDFWLYYIAYFCGATIGLVYSNNLGQIAQSLGESSNTTRLVTLYSSCSFFGRLLSAAPDFMREKLYFARTGWLAIALVPTPIAFMLLALSGSATTLHASTALIGLSSGFIFAAAVSITSELFGPNSIGVNHNILITNIPIGSLLYGLLAAIVYDDNVSSSKGIIPAFTIEETMVCMGRKCYRVTFVWWACISLVGLASSVLLFVRTKPAYDSFEQNRIRTQVY